MAIDHIMNIRYLLNKGDISANLKGFHPLPDYCPQCHYSIVPQYILINNQGDTSELLCGCPRNECGSLFFTVYQLMEQAEYDYELIRYYPYNKQEKEFPEEVSALSSEFVSIYNQAHHADQEGLDMICGVGYRKALEFLIKDYAIDSNPDQTEKIQKMPLQQCINAYIDQADIKDMAERAIWIGNDETHYVRKWSDKDIRDLKNLIDLTVYYLSMALKARKYREEMTK